MTALWRLTIKEHGTKKAAANHVVKACNRSEEQPRQDDDGCGIEATAPKLWENLLHDTRSGRRVDAGG